MVAFYLELRDLIHGLNRTSHIFLNIALFVVTKIILCVWGGGKGLGPHLLFLGLKKNCSQELPLPLSTKLIYEKVYQLLVRWTFLNKYFFWSRYKRITFHNKFTFILYLFYNLFLIYCLLIQIILNFLLMLLSPSNCLSLPSHSLFYLS